MDLPPHLLPLQLQPPPPPSDQPTNLSNFLPADVHPIAFFDSDHSPNPHSSPFVGNGMWFEPAKKRMREQDLVENSQISSIDFFQTGSVSTGLGLSLDDRRGAGTSSVNSPLFPLFGDEIDRELRSQDAEMDRFLKVQGERLRHAILEKLQAKQVQTLTLVEEKVLGKLREKESEVELMNKKNLELEEQLNQLSVEVGAWQNHAKYNENMIMALKFNLQKVSAQSRDNKEGFGDSEVDDTASCCNRAALDFHPLVNNNEGFDDSMACRVCRVNKVCMLLLPCRHLCLCKDCESKLSICPLCHTSKYIGMEIYM